MVPVVQHPLDLDVRTEREAAGPLQDSGRDTLIGGGLDARLAQRS